jgi:hypothetical protein
MEAASVSETLVNLNQACTLENEAADPSETLIFQRTLNVMFLCLLVSSFHQTERMKS